jgi:hypothetical protein
MRVQPSLPPGPQDDDEVWNMFPRMSKVSINYDGMIPVHIRAQHPQHKIAHFRPNQRNECDLVTVTKDGNPLEGLARRLKEIWRLEDRYKI